MQCKDCAYYTEFKNKQPNRPDGTCHRYPPTTWILPANGGGTFIEVREDNWCGEFTTELPAQKKAIAEVAEWVDE